MAENWSADVKRYVPNADDEVITGIVRYCGIALQNRDSSLVSFTDPIETGRVRENFLKKKLGLDLPDPALDQAIADVGQQMKGDHFKNRVTVYYLLLQHFDLLNLFRKGTVAGSIPAAGEVASGAGAAVMAGGAALGMIGAGAGAAASAGGASVSESYKPQSLSGDYRETLAAPAGRRFGLPALLGILAVILLAALLLWLAFFRHSSTADTGSTQTATTTEAASASANTSAPTAAPVTDLSTAPVEGSVTIPAGAGVTTEMRDGKPVVKVYFDTGQTDISPDFAATATGLKDYLAQHAGASLAVSGFNDKTGNVAANALLSKNRAMAVAASLTGAGIPSDAVALVKPSDTTDTSGSNAAARRVEVTVR